MIVRGRRFILSGGASSTTTTTSISTSTTTTTTASSTTTTTTVASDDFTGNFNFSLSGVPDGAFIGTAISNADWEVIGNGNRSGGVIVLDERSNNYSYADNLFLRSKRVARDVEVGFNANTHIALRDNGQSAILFLIRGNSLEISRAENNIPDGYYLNHYNRIYWSTDLSSLTTPVGAGDGSGFKVGAIGYELYVKYNGVKIASVDDWDILHAGKVTFVKHPEQDFGIIGEFTATAYERVPTLANTDAGEIDVREFGYIPDATFKGSMDVSSPNIIQWNSSSTLDISQLKVGMTLVVAVGGETPFNGRSETTLGIKGVGGVWPQTSYPSLSAMNADTSKPDTFISWLETDGRTYRTFGGIWYPVMSPVTVGLHEDPYFNYIIGYARAYDLRTTITSINTGTGQITVDIPCLNSTTNADIWVDSWPVLDKIVRANISGGYNVPRSNQPKIVKIPAGQLVISQQLTMVGRKQGWTFQGAGDSTEVITPRGSKIFFLDAQDDNIVVQNFVIRGNYKNEDWSYRHYDFLGEQTSHFPDDYSVGGDLFNACLLGGLRLGGDGNYITARNIKMFDLHYVAIGMGQTIGTIAENMYIEYSKDPHIYGGWCIGVNGGATGCIVQDIEFNHIVRIPAFEAFGSYDNIFRRLKTKNGWFASNSGVNMLIEDCFGVYEPNTLPTNQVENQMIVNINGNNGYGFGGAATMRRNHFIIYGQDADNSLQRAIVIQDGRDGCLIENNLIEYKSVATSGNQFEWGIGIGTGANNTTIQDNVIITLPQNDAPPYSPSGSHTIHAVYGKLGNVIKRNYANSIDGDASVNIPLTGADANTVRFVSRDYAAIWEATSSPFHLVADGHSYVKGIYEFSEVSPFPGLIGAKLNTKVTNFGVSGQTMENMLIDASSQVFSTFQSGKRNVIFLVEVTNDIYRNGDVAAAIARHIEYATAARAAGFEVITTTGIPRYHTSTFFGDNPTQYNAKIVESNTLLLANASHFDGIIRPDLESIFATYDSAGFDPDRIHPNQLGQQKYADLFIDILTNT